MALPAEKELEEVIVPDGGIADFIISDEDYDELVRQEASKTYGESGGIAEFQEQAARMAQYGRGGDQFVAHLAPGEIVVPAPLIENNPELRDSIFGHLREMGIENPEQYVVGASANSINPETGLMEFGLLSRVFKGVKKVAKSVGKVLKKAAPIILPIIGTAVLGPVWGAALGSGIATLINGGSLKDAAISAAISGGIGAVSAGFSGPAGSSFGQNVSRAMDAGSYLNTFGARVGQTFNEGTFFERGSVFSAPTAEQLGAATQPSVVDPTVAAGSPTSVDQTIVAAGTPQTVQVTDASGNPYVDAIKRGMGNVSSTPVAVSPATAPSVTGMQTGTYQPNMAEILGPTPAPTPAPNAAATPGFFDRSVSAVQDYSTRLFEEPLTTLGDTFFPSGPTSAEIVKTPEFAALTAEGISPDMALKTLQYQMSPGLIQSYLPLAAAGTTVASALGLFDTPVPTEEELSPLGLKRGPTGADLLAADVAAGGTKYTLPASSLATTSATGPTTVASAYGLPESPQVASLQEYLRQQRERLQNPFGPPLPMRAAEGGEVYPRRTGGIMPYEGTQNEDSVRALLMPGEFVLTTNAVKGAGNGDLNRGINNMYGIMRGLEKRGRAMS
jgi:hypothetical protein